MSLAVQQIFVRSSQVGDVKSAIEEYVATFGNRFVSCSAIHLDSVAQVLKGLVRRRREFRLFADQGWTVVWEIVHHTEFADPAVAQFLSKQLKTDSVWIKLDSNYNIWACQEFSIGGLSSETFLPEDYFNGKLEAQVRYDDYGSCINLAQAYDASKSLPLFLETMPAIERKPAISRRIERLVCQLPESTRD